MSAEDIAGKLHAEAMAIKNGMVSIPEEEEMQKDGEERYRNNESRRKVCWAGAEG